MVRRASAAAVALSITGLVLMLPTAAHAQTTPMCQGGTLVTPTNTPLKLPAPPCSNLTGPVTVVIPPLGQPAKGTLTPLANPNLYTPTLGSHGYDQFSYQVLDAINGLSNTAVVHVLVDSAPVCGPTAVTVRANIATALPDLACSDPDHDVFTVYLGDPSHGTLSFPGGNAVYAPTPGYVGPDSLTYFAGEDDFGDDALASDDAVLTITVAAPPPPVATVQPTPVPTAAPKDLTAPTVALKNASKKQAVAITLTTNENASATLTLTLDKATAKKLKLAQKVGTLKAALKPGTSTLKIKLSSKAAKAFKKQKSVKLTVTAVVADAAGNTTTKTLKVTLKK
jgi:Bacterial Ig domain